MKKKLFSVFLIVLTLQLITSNTYAEPDFFLNKYNHARYIQTMMQKKINWAVKLLGQKGEKAFDDLNRYNKTSAIDIYVYDPLSKKMVVAPKYVSVVKGKMEIKDVNPDFYAKEIIKMEIKRLTSSDLDKLISLVEPFDFKDHMGKIALTPSGKAYVVATGLKNVALAKVFIVDIVKSACKLMEKEGVNAAFKEFNKMGSRYRNKNTYVYVLTDKGKWLVDPNYPEAVGKEMYNYAGSDNTYPIKKFVKAVSQAPYSSWIYTKSLAPREKIGTSNRIDFDKSGKNLKEKLSFIKKIRTKGQTYIVGSGVYLEDINQKDTSKR
jgi:hypothetical protein